MPKAGRIFDLVRARKLDSPIAILRSTILIDPVWYRETNADLRGTAIDAASHYLAHGAREGRNPHPLFDTRWYVDRTAGASTSGMNPLVHFLKHETFENTHPHPLFDVGLYLSKTTGATSTTDPLTHYLTIGWKCGLQPSQYFDPEWYLEQYPDVRATGIEPLTHYLLYGWRENRRPNAAIDPAAYRARNNLSHDAIPLFHFALIGDRPLVSESSDKQELVPSSVETSPWAIAPSGRAAKPRTVLEVPFEVWRTPQSLKGKDVCILVAFCPDGCVPKSTVHYLKSLIAEKLTVILIVASNNSGPPCSDMEITCDGLISRENFGYDFASWSLGLQILPSIWDARSVTFTNDSVFGPLTAQSFARMVARIDASPADYIALTQSWQVKHHTQSYYFVYKEKALRNIALRRFWSQLEIAEDRHHVILNYEVPMLGMLNEIGIDTEIMFPLGNRDFERDANPTLDHWRDLIKEGFPFIKVQALRDDISGVDKSDWNEGIELDAEVYDAIRERLDSDSERQRKSAIVRSDK